MWLLYIYLFLVAAVLLLGLFRYDKNTLGQKWLLPLLAMVMVVEVFSIYATKYEVPNIHIMNTYIVIELLLLYKIANTEDLISTQGLRALIVGTLILATINGVFFQDFYEVLNFNTFIFGAFVMVTLVLIVLHKYLSKDTASPIWKFPVFWILSAHGLYYISSLLHFGLYYYYLDMGDEKMLKFLQDTNLALNYVLYTLLFFSFFVHQSLVSQDVSE